MKQRELTGWWTGELVGNIVQVGDDGLDTVTLAFDLGLKTFHLVAIEGVADILSKVSQYVFRP